MKHILVIGAGVIGLSTAYYAARRGHRVTVIDRNGEQRDGCSFGNAGLIVPSHFVPLAAPGMVKLGLKWMWHPESPFYIKPRLNFELLDWALKFWRASTSRHVQIAAPLLRDLNNASRACFEELSEPPGPGFGLVKNGLMMLCKEQQTLDHEAEMAAQARTLGIPAQVLDARQTAALTPGVRLEVVGAVYFPQDCHLSPNIFMSALKERCGQLGVAFKWSADVITVAHDGSRITTVKTIDAEHTADEYVVCGGSWSPNLTRQLGLRLPIQAGKGYSLTLPEPRQLPGIPLLFTEARVAVTPMGRSLRFGGTMEIAGLNEDVNPVRVQGIIKSVPKYFPDFTPKDFEGVTPWRGLRPCSPDGLPYVGRTARFQNLSIAAGHAMMGLSLGPITGKLMAEILSGETPSVSIEALSPDRYA